MFKLVCTWRDHSSWWNNSVASASWWGRSDGGYTDLTTTTAAAAVSPGRLAQQLIHLCVQFFHPIASFTVAGSFSIDIIARRAKCSRHVTKKVIYYIQQQVSDKILTDGSLNLVFRFSEWPRRTSSLCSDLSDVSQWRQKILCNMTFVYSPFSMTEEL